MCNDGSSPNVLLQELIKNELGALRQELLHLKECQLRYVLFGITTSGAASAFVYGEHLNDIEKIMPCILLLPVAIALPFWCIYFDKSTTITRIVGYYRIIECILIKASKGNSCDYRYIGWENALKEYRNQIGNYKEALKCKLLRMSWHEFTKPGYYWMLTWLTFFCITSIGIAAFITAIQKHDMWHSLGSGDILISFVVVAAWMFSSFYTTSTLCRLLSGDCSYDYREAAWKKILGPNTSA